MLDSADVFLTGNGKSLQSGVRFGQKKARRARGRDGAVAQAKGTYGLRRNTVSGSVDVP